jgi:hypothetical protein
MGNTAASEMHTPKPVGHHMRGNTPYCMRQVRDCVETMRYIESLGPTNTEAERAEHGWSREDSHEDSRSWAQYFAGQVISGEASRYPAAAAQGASA